MAKCVICGLYEDNYTQNKILNRKILNRKIKYFLNLGYFYYIECTFIEIIICLIKVILLFLKLFNNLVL